MIRACLALFLLVCLPVPVLAARSSQLCDQAAARAARATGVPAHVMQALTRTETGREDGGVLKPWPWAVNQAGQGYWFDTADEAVQFVEAQLEFGYSNIDIGCFQLNHRWHADSFPSVTEMFDPEANARYAAAYLMSKYQETGDWITAAAAYHSGTPEYAERYATRFADILGSMEGAPPPDQGLWADDNSQPAARENRFPLLVAGAGRASSGSLMPLVSGGASLFGPMP